MNAEKMCPADGKQLCAQIRARAERFREIRR
jgi:hypothetical protein